MERPIGDVFEYDGLKLMVVPADQVCRGCYFRTASRRCPWLTERDTSIIGGCGNIIFVPVEMLP